MNLRLTGRHVEITPHLRKHVEAHFEKLDRLDHHTIEGELVLFRDRAFDVAEGKFLVGPKHLNAKAQGPDFYVAVNSVFTKIQKQLQRHESRLKKPHRRSLARGGQS